jgi:hypothetical protein
MQSLLVDLENNVPREEGVFQKVEDERIRMSYNFGKICN